MLTRFSGPVNERQRPKLSSSMQLTVKAPVREVMLDRVREFAQAFGRFTMREKGYTTLACARLEEVLPYRVFTPSGAMVNTVHQYLTPEQKLLAGELRNGNDFYPDILITQRPLTELEGGNLRQLEAITPLGVEALIELKFHNSFTSMTRRHVIEDAVKLEILGHYIQALTGTRPLLEFLYFNFPHPEAGIRRPELLRRWLAEAKMKAPTVACSIVTNDGTIEAIA